MVHCSEGTVDYKTTYYRNMKLMQILKIHVNLNLNFILSEHK